MVDNIIPVSNHFSNLDDGEVPDEIEIAKCHRRSCGYDMFDIATQSNFKNPNFILKFQNQSNLKFFKDELTIKYTGKGYNLIDYATVQSNNQISKNDPIFYYEMEIGDEGSKKDITIGFSDKEVVLNKQCGTISKSYGYNGDGKAYNDDNKSSFGPKFKKGDIIGCGFYFSKNSIFYSYNGKFLNYAFKTVDLTGNYYATISLHSGNECVKVNFGKSNFIFDIEGFYIQETKNKGNHIIEIDTQVQDLDYIVKEYLVHSGYEDTFNAIETTNVSDDTSPQEEKKEIDDMMKIDIDEEEDIKIRKYSSEEKAEIRKRTLSFGMESQGEGKDIFKIMNFGKERKILQSMLNHKDFDTALEYFAKHFNDFLTTKEAKYKKIILCMTTMKYLTLLKTNNYQQAFEVFNDGDKSYWSNGVNITGYDNNNETIDVNIQQLSSLLCYDNGQNTELCYYLSDKQKDLLLNQINSGIGDMSGLSVESILEKILKQQKLVNGVYNTVKNCPGENMNIKFN